MASSLTEQVRNIATVTTAVANGDLSEEGHGGREVLELKDTINTMVDQLSAFAAEVTRVAREVGTEGMLGGQAEVAGVSGTWKDTTENVNLLAGNLTSQVLTSRRSRPRSRRAISPRRSPSRPRARSASSPGRSTRWSTSSRPSPPR